MLHFLVKIVNKSKSEKFILVTLKFHSLAENRKIYLVENALKRIRSVALKCIIWYSVNTLKLYQKVSNFLLGTFTFPMKYQQMVGIDIHGWRNFY